jgi:hypothetical protein
VGHNNGVGSNFYDCIAVDAWSSQLATAAAAAWAPDGAASVPQLYAGCVSWTSSSNGVSTCGVWCYASLGGGPPGSVYVNTVGSNCLSPAVAGTYSTWQ